MDNLRFTQQHCLALAGVIDAGDIEWLVPMLRSVTLLRIDHIEGALRSGPPDFQARQHSFHGISAVASTMPDAVLSQLQKMRLSGCWTSHDDFGRQHFEVYDADFDLHLTAGMADGEIWPDYQRIKHPAAPAVFARWDDTDDYPPLLVLSSAHDAITLARDARNSQPLDAYFLRVKARRST